MKARKFSWALNLLTLVAMALALVVAPVSADPEAPVDVTNVEVHVDPPNAKAGAHFVFVFQLTTPVPLSGEFWAQFPDVYWTPGVPGGPSNDQIDRLGDRNETSLDVANVAWSTDQLLGHGDVITVADLSVIPNPEVTTPPDGMNTIASQTWITDGQVRLTIDDTHGPTQLPAGTWMRIDFWGPASENPGRENAGIVNPDEAGTYPFCNATDEEQELVCVDVVIDPPLPVRLYRKRLVPLLNSNYTWLEYIAGFETIEEALAAANDVWNNTPPYEDEPWWNLFETCPDFSDVCAWPDQCSDDELAFLASMLKEVAVGVVIEVDADTDSDGVADVYTNTLGALNMNTPGLILGSLANETTGVERAVIEADGLVLVNENAVNILAGGVTLGASDIVVGTDAYGEPDEWENLNGFEIRNADEDGVYVALTSGDCVGTPVYAPTVEGYGYLTNTVLDEGAMSIEFDDVVGWDDDIVDAIEYCDNLDQDIKIANLTSGWSAHVGPSYAGTEWVLGTLVATIDISATGRFTDGDSVAIFCSGDYVCTDARVDIRENDIHDHDLNGIYVYSASVWVDGGETKIQTVHGNGEDGFYGRELKCCHGVAICDGFGRTDKMLEISSNQFYDNGDDTDGGYVGDDNCFDPTGTGTDAGIDIHSTNDGGLQCVEEHLYIHDNLIYENDQAGIWLDDRAAECGTRILWNEIRDNDIFGVSSWAADFARKTLDFTEPVSGTVEIDVIFKYNDVYGNPYWGVKNWRDHYGESEYFNAKENYWGVNGELGEGPASGGPSAGRESCLHQWDQDSNAQGNGDAVSKASFYNPWLSESYLQETGEPGCDRRGDEGKRYYGSDSLTLQEGWNTLAIPLSLYDSANTVGEIELLGSFFDTAGVVYEYDAVLDQFATAAELEPARGYYVKMGEASKFPVLYDNQNQSPAAFPLETGWNLIGSAFGIDRDWGEGEFVWEDWLCDDCDVITDTFNDPYDQGRWAVPDPDVAAPDVLPPDSVDGGPDPEALMKASDALASIIWGSNEGAQIVINPTLPGQIANAWATPAESLDADMRYMYTGEAYWVFMNKVGWLGGFEAPALYHDPYPLPVK